MDMMTEAEKPAKRKAKSKQEAALLEEDDTDSNNSGDVGGRLAAIQQQKKARGRPVDDKTMEISIGPSIPGKDDDDSDVEEEEDGDDSKNYRPGLGTLSQDSEISLLSMASKQTTSPQSPEFEVRNTQVVPIINTHAVPMPPLVPVGLLPRVPAPLVAYYPPSLPPQPIHYGRFPPDHFINQQPSPPVSQCSESPQPQPPAGPEKKKSKKGSKKGKKKNYQDILEAQKAKEAEKNDMLLG
jgi:hypothetical protein